MLLKISEWLDLLSIWAKSNSIYFELKYYIKKNKSSYLHSKNYSRGSGKSYNLVKLAIKYKLPIYCNNHSAKDYLLRMARCTFNKTIQVIVANEYARGYRFDKALIDEGIDFQIINDVIKPKVKTLIGFNSCIF